MKDPNVGALMGSFGVVAGASSGVGAGRPFEESGLVSDGAKFGMPKEVALRWNAGFSRHFNDVWDSIDRFERDQPGMHLGVVVFTQKCRVCHAGGSTFLPGKDMMAFTGGCGMFAGGNDTPAVSDGDGSALGLGEAADFAAEVEHLALLPHDGRKDIGVARISAHAGCGDGLVVVGESRLLA